MWRRRSSVLAIWWVATIGCRPAPMETVKSPGPTPSATTSAADVRVDFPEPKESVESGGIAALRMPASRADVEHLVIAYFKAIAREDIGAIAEASVRGAATKGGGSLLESWRTRFGNSAFQLLANRDIPRIDEMEIRRGADSRIVLPGELSADITVYVPLNPSILSGEALLGSHAVLLLKNEGKALKIVYASDESPR